MVGIENKIQQIASESGATGTTIKEENEEQVDYEDVQVCDLDENHNDDMKDFE